MILRNNKKMSQPERGPRKGGVKMTMMMSSSLTGLSMRMKDHLIEDAWKAIRVTWRTREKRLMRLLWICFLQVKTKKTKKLMKKVAQILRMMVKMKITMKMRAMKTMMRVRQTTLSIVLVGER